MMMTRMMMFLFQYLQYVATYIIASAIKLSYVPYLSILLSILIIHPSIKSILILIIVSFIIYPHHPSLPSSSPTSPSHHQQHKNIRFPLPQRIMRAPTKQVRSLYSATRPCSHYQQTSHSLMTMTMIIMMMVMTMKKRDYTQCDDVMM